MKKTDGELTEWMYKDGEWLDISVEPVYITLNVL